MARVDPIGKQAFAKARRAENNYGISLRRVARHVADLISSAPLDNIDRTSILSGLLRKYAEIIEPWAEAAAHRMLVEVSLRDTQAWELHSRQMGYAVAREIKEAPTGAILRQLQADQVRLIKSLPLEAAEQVHEKTLSGISQGKRYSSIIDEIRELGTISRNRATLIARTEVGRTASNLTQARATFIGSEGYIWRTSRDAGVRPTHVEQDGRYIRWDNPPKTDANLAPYHAGCGPNCRCYAEPVIPSRFLVPGSNT
jgi:SPP1 gp7 family putative phage head morphogenesis protein